MWSASRRRAAGLDCIACGTLLAPTLGVLAVSAALGGSVSSPEALARDLRSPLESPQDWAIGDWPVFRHRLLFRGAVGATYALLRDANPAGDAAAFHLAYVLVSGLLLYASVAALYFLLRSLDFGRGARVIGCLLYLASPPVALAYVNPVHTREDPFAYLLVALGMIAILERAPRTLAALAAVATGVRETALLILPVHLLVSDAPWSRRLLVCAPAAGALLALRVLLGPGAPEVYAADPFQWSAVNLTRPLEAAGFLFLTFGALWFAAAGRWRELARDAGAPAWRALVRSTPLAFALVLGTAVLLARPREMRIAFLLFPWTLPLALDWLRARGPALRALARDPSYWLYAALVAAAHALVFGFLGLAALRDPAFLRAQLGFLAQPHWLALLALHLLLAALLVLPPHARAQDRR